MKKHNCVSCNKELTTHTYGNYCKKCDRLAARLGRLKVRIAKREELIANYQAKIKSWKEEITQAEEEIENIIPTLPQYLTGELFSGRFDKPNLL